MSPCRGRSLLLPFRNLGVRMLLELTPTTAFAPLRILLLSLRKAIIKFRTQIFMIIMINHD
jgi:hypothetical protein